MNDAPTSPPTPSRRGLRTIILTAIVTAILTTLAAVGAVAAASTFADVNEGHTHEDGISWLVATGVTAGCAANLYCPDDPVTRDQMATFMHRLSGNADGVDPSVDAATLQGLTVEEIQQGVETDPGDEAGPQLEILAGEVTGRTTGDPSVSANVGIESVERDDEGVFTVTLERSIADCAISVSPHRAASKNPETAELSRPAGGNEFTVYTYLIGDNVQPTDGNFTVTAICTN